MPLLQSLREKNTSHWKDKDFGWSFYICIKFGWFIDFPLLLHSLAVGANGTDLSLWNLTSLLKILNAKFQNENPRKSFWTSWNYFLFADSAEKKFFIAGVFKLTNCALRQVSHIDLFGVKARGEIEEKFFTMKKK